MLNGLLLMLLRVSKRLKRNFTTEAHPATANVQIANSELDETLTLRELQMLILLAEDRSAKQSRSNSTSALRQLNLTELQ